MTGEPTEPEPLDPAGGTLELPPPEPSAAPAVFDQADETPEMKDRVSGVRERLAKAREELHSTTVDLLEGRPMSELKPGEERRRIDMKVVYVTEDPVGLATNIIPAIETAVRSTCAKENLPLETFTIQMTTEYGPRAVG